MVGEFVFLTDIINICQWTNTLLVTFACIPLVLFALLSKFIPRRRNELFKLEWREDYFERGVQTIALPENDSEEKSRVKDSEGEVQVLGVQDPQQADTNEQTT